MELYHMLVVALMEMVRDDIVPHAGDCVDGDDKRWYCTK
jgi:hypothetical protein